MITFTDSVVLTKQDYDPFFSRFASADTSFADHAVGVDVGDLCAELDQRIGEPIERAVGRYLDKAITRHIRENVVRELAEKIITYDRVVKESNG